LGVERLKNEEEIRKREDEEVGKWTKRSSFFAVNMI
jgi:hypothetical protein